MRRDKDIQDSTKAVALIFLKAMDDAATVVGKHDEQAQYFLECVRDELAPQLKWAFRYGEWQLDAAPFRTDDAADETGFGWDDDTEVDP